MKIKNTSPYPDNLVHKAIQICTELVGVSPESIVEYRFRLKKKDARCYKDSRRTAHYVPVPYGKYTGDNSPRPRIIISCGQNLPFREFVLTLLHELGHHYHFLQEDRTLCEKKAEQFEKLTSRACKLIWRHKHKDNKEVLK